MRLESDSAVILSVAHSNTEDSGMVFGGFFLGGVGGNISFTVHPESEEPCWSIAE